jgi:O-antigen ligase
MSIYLILAAAFACFGVATWRGAARGTTDGSPVVSAMLLAWIGLFFGSGLRFDPSRDPLASASGDLSAENFFELALTGLAALVGLHVMLCRRRRVIRVWFLLPGALFFGSVAWSISPLLTVGKSFSIVTYGVLTAAMLRLEPAEIERVVLRALVWFVRGISALSVLGIVLGTSVADRWTWPGTFPGVAGTNTAIAIVLIIVLRRFGKELLSASMAWIMAVPIVIMHLGSYTRSATLSLAVVLGIAVLFVFKARWGSRLSMAFGMASALATIAFLATLSAWIYSLLDRSDRQEDLSQLNGRRGLWSETLPLLAENGRVLLGFGYAASRSVLLGAREWAGTAHSLVHQLLLDVGVVGVAMLTILVLGLIAEAWKMRQINVLPSRALLYYVVFWIPVSLTSEALALPGAPLGMLFLLAGGATSRPLQQRSFVSPRMGPVARERVATSRLSSGSAY